MAGIIKNYTFSLPSETVDKIREFAKDDYITSLNADVKEALEEYASKLENEKFKNEMIEAANDQIFIKDMMDSMKDFESSDADIAGGIQEW